MSNKLEEVVQEYTKEIKQTEEVSECKKLRSRRKLPKQSAKQIREWISRKRKYENDFKIFGARNSYFKTDPDATLCA